MKRTIIKLLLAVTALIAPLAAKADLIWYDGFQYPNGSIEVNSSGLWIKESGTAAFPGDMLTLNSNLQVAATSAPNGISRQDDCQRFLSLTNNSIYTNSAQLLYASFTVICTNLPNGAGSYFASFYNTNKGYVGKVLAFTNGTILPNTWRMAVSGNATSGNTAPANGGYQVDLALNTPYQVVEELDPVTLLAATLWINPVNINQTGNPTGANPPTETHFTSSDSISTFATTTPACAYAFRQASSFGNAFFLVTNLALATTFAEAATNVWKTNAISPAIIYQPVGLTNFVGASIALSAVANGQGLGNVTYNWLKNGSPYPSGNGTNILAIPSAQTTDSGNYTLVVTTPYGLSVTSSVAKVLISSAPVPPSFVTQPISQKAYIGQTVILSTTVISPGNVNYQWFSNNVAIVGQNASTLELDNVTTNFSASYKVAVTNDVVVNGIVSTNAVLTVLAPSQVSIAYLRTLVDPNNGYNPTNTPPTIPYQITGTVTTFTNLTTGNTSSYYLQDGTAGINIFVTGGSSFRPAQGDVVTFIGVLSGFSSGLELYADSADTSYPYTSYNDTGSTNALPAPIPISFDVATNQNNLNYNIDGSLVKLSDVYFGTNSGLVLSTTANKVVTVTNSSGKSFNLFFAYLDLDTAGQTLPSYASSVSGVMYGIYTNNVEVAVTRFSDINTNPVPVPLTTLLSGSNLTISWGDPLSAFYLQSATNVVGPYDYIQGASSPFTTNVTSLPMQFFRLTSQAPAPPVTN